MQASGGEVRFLPGVPRCICFFLQIPWQEKAHVAIRHSLRGLGKGYLRILIYF